MRRFLLPIAVATSLVLAGCGASGGDGDTTPTAATDEDTTTTSSPDTTTAPSADDDGSDDEADPADEADSQITGEQLEAILPTAEDLGPEWMLDDLVGAGEAVERDDEEEEDDPTSEAIEEACPALTELDLDDEPTEDDVSASFVTPEGLTLDVDLGPVPGDLGEDGLRDLVDALAECGEFEIEEDDLGITVALDAEPSDEYGDYGARIEYTFAFDAAGQPMSVTLVGNLFAVGDIGVAVGGGSGLDNSTGEVIAAPVELVDELSAEMEQRVRSL